MPSRLRRNRKGGLIVCDFIHVFDKLMERARIEGGNINLIKDTIWLSDVGFAFDNKYFCVSSRGNEDDDAIARWELSKLGFFEKLKCKIQFKKLLNKLHDENSKKAKNKYLQKELDKQQKVINDMCVKIGINRG